VNTLSREEWDALARRTAFVCLHSQTRLRFRGSDAVRYLNGQLTNNVNKLKPGEALPACVLTLKGKLSALVFLHQTPEGIELDAPPELREPLTQRLERYIIADDVEMQDVTEEISLVHVVSDTLPDTLPGNPHRFLNARFGTRGWDLVVPASALSDLARALESAGLRQISKDGIENWRVCNGVPTWGSELTPDIIPLEAGLGNRAVDFHKGCYLGQEIISRIESIGHVNKELRLLVSRGGQPFSTGLILREESAADASGTRDRGWITSLGWSFALEKPVALGYVRRPSDATGLVAVDPETNTEPIAVENHPLPNHET
jgi:folate-binding protein YgfZ